MTNVLYYLAKRELNAEIKDVTLEYFQLISKYKGIICKKCGVIQGSASNGFWADYCDHISQRVERKLKNKNEKIAKMFVTFAVASDELKALQSFP